MVVINMPWNVNQIARSSEQVIKRLFNILDDLAFSH